MQIKEYQKVWVYRPIENESRKNTINASISSYEGRGTNGKSIYSSWFAHFVGKAYDKAKEIKEGDEIALVSAKMNTWYSKETAKGGVVVTIFDFEMVEDKSATANNPKSFEEVKENEATEEVIENVDDGVYVPTF